VNDELKALVEELGAAINASLADAPRINEVIEKIRETGNDIFLILEATICLENKAGEKIFEEAITSTNNKDFDMSSEDRKFLKSLKIKIDDSE